MKPGEIRQMVIGFLGGLGMLLFTLIVSMPLPLVIALPIAAYFGSYMISKPQLKIGGIALSEANGEDMKALMQEGSDDILALEKGMGSIRDPEIKNLAKALYQRGVDIFQHLQQNPDKISKARRFINYYLDTAAGLITKYESLSKSNVQGQSVEKAKGDVKEGLSVLVRAFDREFEHLMQGEIMDIETDVKVLTQTFKSEE
ncbi:MAG: 5-bromo-4-chloroindolyl phosphate hydrolysis family protein [Tissierellia bacterium]|nr:5-bromo-4-chloroindolyl phosphate hydrolysis family protein [Tissierellia bacterium]